MQLQKLLPLLLLSLLLFQCTNKTNETKAEIQDQNLAKPYARYWWFASEIKKEDVKYNLDWLKEHGFGGVELAFVYPLNAFDAEDTSYTPRQAWYSEELKAIIKFTIQYADSIGLGCDLTYGTLWPFGDSQVKFEEGTQRFGDSSWRQVISKSWEYPLTAYVVDHLTPAHYKPYFERMSSFFPSVETKIPQAYFIDSWEVETERLWSKDFEEDFLEIYKYDIVPHMDSIYQPGFENYLYDYMKLISKKVLRFYTDFDLELNKLGVASRGQVSGAPCDLISGYALLDIPEGEAMLFEPEFSAIPASAAMLSGKKIVSAETFTCLYGWPRDYIREEQTADLKLVADALFANGINKIIWHGKAHNPAHADSVNFYASVHLGNDGSLAKETKAFNAYLEKISSYMQKGHTYSDIAVYLPTEDAWMAGIMPIEKQFKWAWGYYEMRYIYFPDELKNYSPTWINVEFLAKAKVENGSTIIGNHQFKALYFNTKYLDYDVLKELHRLGMQGARIILKQNPKEPGINQHEDYTILLEEILSSKQVLKELPTEIDPFIKGDRIPEHWSRKEGDALYIFFPSPKSKGLKFPIEYGQALRNASDSYEVKIDFLTHSYELELSFDPYQSLLIKLENGMLTPIDIHFEPKTPIRKERPADYKAPWLLK